MVHFNWDPPQNPIPVVFFKRESGNEPVREWLKSLSAEDKKLIGVDIKAVQFGWPLGLPLVRKLVPGIWEVRTRLQNRIARILFTVQEGQIILLHGFIKKTQKLSEDDLYLAIKRLREYEKDK